jgi:hypothetical protein
MSAGQSFAHETGSGVKLVVPLAELFHSGVEQFLQAGGFEIPAEPWCRSCAGSLGLPL